MDMLLQKKKKKKKVYFGCISSQGFHQSIGLVIGGGVM
jgi:hypothetical protein